MEKVSAHGDNELYKVVINSPSGNQVIADEPEDKGGKDLGFRPQELLASALAACKSITVKMYAERKGWELEAIDVDTEIIRSETEPKTDFVTTISLKGNLTDEQRQRLLKVAEACPVHKILTNPIAIQTSLV